MADLKISGNLTVAGLKKRFKSTFGCSLRVYTTPANKAFAKDDATLASIRAEGAKGGELTVGGNLRVGSFEKKWKRYSASMCRCQPLMTASWQKMILPWLQQVRNNL